MACESGVRIYDNEIKSNEKVVAVYIKPTGIKCSYDDRDDCDHVKLTLSFPEVRDLIKKKGWRKIELPVA